MKKNISRGLIILFFVAIMTSPALAQPEAGLIAGTAGYLTPGTFVAVGFNAYAGETLLFSSSNLDFFSTTGFCGLSSYDALGDLLAVAYSWEDVFIQFYYDDLYVWLCDFESGLSGNIILTVYEAFPFYPFSMNTRFTSRESIGDYPVEAVDRLKETFGKIKVRMNQRQ